VAGCVVAARRSNAPWARAFRAYLVIGLIVVATRVVFRIIFGGTTAGGEYVLIRLPSISIGDVVLGGPVTVESVVAALYDGLRLATLLCCIGAANTLANPKRALRSLPGALYEIGVAITVAITIAPQLVEGAQRVHRARRLRGATSRGRRAVRNVAMPVFHSALDRSFELAAAMVSASARTACSTRRRRACWEHQCSSPARLRPSWASLLADDASRARAIGPIRGAYRSGSRSHAASRLQPR
jgi:energy-coupling factor transport system permease protein